MRPSEFYHIQDELVGYYFDRAVTTFGLAIEAALHDAGKDAKTTKKAEQARQRVLNDWLEIPGQRFRDPLASAKEVQASSVQPGIVKL